MRILELPFARKVSITLALYLMVNLLLHRTLWSHYRELPIIPIHSLLGHFPLWGHSVLLGLCLGSLGLILFGKENKYIHSVGLLSFTGLCLLDINRFHPPILQAMLVWILIISKNINHKEGDSSFTQGLKIILGLFYLWGGIHKINISFPLETFPAYLSLIIPRSYLSPSILWPGSIIVIAMEIYLGLSLLIGKGKKYFIPMAFIFHLSVIISVGLLKGHATVTVWNLFMLALAVLISPFSIDTKITSKLNKALLVFLLVMPGLRLVDAVDFVLGLELYTGRSNRAFILFPKSKINHLPPATQKQVIPYNRDHYILSVWDWASHQHGTPPYRGMFMYKKLKNFMCAQLEGKMAMIILNSPGRLQGTKSYHLGTCQNPDFTFLEQWQSSFHIQRMYEKYRDPYALFFTIRPKNLRELDPIQIIKMDIRKVQRSSASTQFLGK